jgi:hypothetical protein
VIAQSVLRWATGRPIGVLGFDSRRRLGIFLFTTASRTTLGPTQHPIQWVPGALSLGVKRPGREADHSPPCSAEFKNVWSYTSTPPIGLHGVVLPKHGDNFTFYVTYAQIYRTLINMTWMPCLFNFLSSVIPTEAIITLNNLCDRVFKFHLPSALSGLKTAH